MATSTAQQGAVDGATQTDLPTRKATNSPHRSDICCIFVHAGAGYHSIANERIHLDACNDAAQIAMLILRNGGSALDAAEMAVKVLEDREITNAGFGSNLAMDGVVECDASIVDHHGRSGAVGAVFKIKNPVSLARLVLNHTMETLTLRRVPPNLLVGQGALDFAREMGVLELPYDALVSDAARERWSRWRSDLKGAERKARKAGHHSSRWRVGELNSPGEEAEAARIRRDHTNNMLQDCSLEPNSPIPSGADDPFFGTPSNTTASGPPSSQVRMSTLDSEPAMVRPQSIAESSRSAFINSTQKVPTISQYRDTDVTNGSPRFTTQDGALLNTNRIAMTHRSWADGSGEESDSASTSTRPADSAIPHAHVDGTADHITDTVGAIAIDGWGNIACAASSGGIGMKHRGRVGPAALVGVGAAVVPIDPDDPEEICVGTVTSGTGEHMATTMAATVCAERLYQSVKKGKGGEYIDATEDEALRSMIDKEFMGHPSVKHSNSAGAIGILGVKKTRQGVMLYFGHNTDSFAMASMHSDEDTPWCAMSRSNGNGSIAQGGRMMRYQRKKKTKTATPH
ncbi:N-terminal nucleophile aminohydrolase [Massarina eburnea CBS 473.64]|uniref:N-terminal nucleophile aminohydrolase n=1 Tax=Massarina eburnea CBS 473.64 TaxID=1395130 RepID=A0A6A6RTG1_9PLEO|nr:N-terminal nucleophile aminohydrolase [Massarina eburnea CBS 473.64]